MSGSEDITTKACKDCGEEKPVSEFHVDRSRKDGLQFYCKVCNSARAAAYREARKKAYVAVVSPETKVCRDCGEEKFASEFTVDRSRKDGLNPYCKTCTAARSAAWSNANKEKRAAKGAEYRAAHKEEIAARMADWYETNKERIVARMAEYYLENREKILTKNAEWARANPEKVAALNSNRRAFRQSTPGIHTAGDIQAQYERQKGHCYWCNCQVDDEYHVDHVVPLSKGGSNWPSNLVVACPTCNSSKHAKHPMDYAGIML